MLATKLTNILVIYYVIYYILFKSSIWGMAHRRNGQHKTDYGTEKVKRLYM